METSSEVSVLATGICDVPVGHVQSQATRSYECSFCKKGFSNAQALGGHMNIHRKDKAKLKQASKGTKMLKENAVSENSLTDSRITRKPLEFTSGQGKSINPKWGGIFFPPEQESISSPQVTDESHMVLPKQMPMFVETFSRADYSNPIIERSSTSWQEELDLELRLGHSHSASPGFCVSSGIIKFL